MFDTEFEKRNTSCSFLGLPMIKKFLNLLPPGAGLKEREKLEHMPPEFQIDELFDVPGVGTVVGGRASTFLLEFFWSMISWLLTCI